MKKSLLDRMTTITLEPEIRNRLKKLRRINDVPRRNGTHKFESYADVIKRILDALDREE